MKRAIGVKIKLICLSGAVLLILGSAPAQAQICEAAGGAKCLYVAPGGSDSNPGTFAAPFKTFRPALGSATAGDFIYARGGAYGFDNATVANATKMNTVTVTSCPPGQVFAGGSCYRPNYTMVPISDWNGYWYNLPSHNANSGVAGNPITLKSYPGEHVLFKSSASAITVSMKSHWVIQGFDIDGSSVPPGGLVYIGGGTSTIPLTHDIVIRDNDLHDFVTVAGSNVGLVKINRGDYGGPYNIYIWNNKLHVMSDPADPGRWSGLSDLQHYGGVALQSRETYLGFDGGGTGYIEIKNNEFYNLPQAFFFKNPMPGPVLIQNNIIHDSDRLGIMSAANVRMIQNLVYNVPTGWWQVGGLGGNDYPNDQRFQDIAGQNAIIQYNTFVGLNGLLNLWKGTGHLIANNVFFGLNGRTTGAGWDTPAFLQKSYNTPDDRLDPDHSRLQKVKSQSNCFITPYSDFQFVSRYWTNPSVVEHDSYAAANRLFGLDSNSTILLQGDASQIFVDPAADDYHLIDRSACPGMGYHAYVAPTDITPPVISAAAAVNIETDAATIRWTTDEPADSQVEYGTMTVYNLWTRLNYAASAGHGMALSGLLPGSLYHCRIRARDEAGNLTVSGDFTFTTPSTTADSMPPARPRGARIR